jgi:hypothetical protein
MSEEEVGLGISQEIENEIPTEKVWQVLLIKITEPNLFIPVTDVVHRPSDDGVGTYREMSMGPHRIIENIYPDKENFEIKFVDVDENSEIVNRIVIDPASKSRSLEFYKRDSTSKQRIHWAIPRKGGEEGIRKCLEMAKKFQEKGKA